MDALTHGFQLEGLLVAPLTGELSGPGGIVRLDPKVMDVLVLMAGHPRQVMLREELVANIWGHAIVTDDALTRCFYELRRHLARAGGDERYRAMLETLPKRGYRLNATPSPCLPAPSVPSLPTPPAGKASRRNRTVAAAAAAMALVAIAGVLYLWSSSGQAPRPAGTATIHSIAVLPFLDLSEESNQHYLADGVTEEILNHLAQSTNLRVIARTSTFALREAGMDVPEIAERLGVEYVLEGSVRRSGNRVRVTAQLIDVGSNAHAWSRTYERPLDDLFAVQDEIAASVGAALEVELASEVAKVGAEPKFEAYDQFLRGQYHWHRRATGDVDRAVQYFQRAVEIDPQFARAWAALAGAYSLVADAGNAGGGYRDLQGTAARRAVTLDPGLAVAHARIAQFYQRTGQRMLADQHFRKAVELDPNDPLVLGFSASRAVLRDDLPAAVETWQRVVAQDPLSFIHRNNYGQMLMAAGRPQEAIVEFRAAIELNPDEPDNRVELARAHILAGATQDAVDLLRDVPPGQQRDLAFALLVNDARYGPEARKTLQDLRVPPTEIRLSVRLAEALVNAGDREAAIGLLQAARVESERRPTDAPMLRSHLREDIFTAPFLAPLRADPRWPAIVAPPPPAPPPS